MNLKILMKTDSEIALERVHSEAFGALMSIQSYRDLDAAYFDRMRSAVSDAVSFFRDDVMVPKELLDELSGSANILRNEGMAFPGREPACSDMADWLEAQAKSLLKG